MNEHSGVPSPELITEWVRGSSQSEPMFSQIAVIAARWGYEQGIKEGKRRTQKLLCEMANYMD